MADRSLFLPLDSPCVSSSRFRPGRRSAWPVGLWLGLLVVLSSCSAVGPDYVPPSSENLTPAPEWSASDEAAFATAEEPEAAWWEDFGDAGLTRAVESSLEGNLALREAIERLFASRAALGIARADRFPFVDGVSAANQALNSREIVGGDFFPRSASSLDLGVSASWEIDLFGRVRRSIEAASADLAASVEGARDVQVLIMAEAAQRYIALRGGQARLRIARENIALQQSTLELSQARFKAGLVSELDVAQARAILESTRASVGPLEQLVRSASFRLATLSGRAPGVGLVNWLSTEGRIPRPPQGLALGVPADLLRRRPDLRQAERVLAASTARIGVAEAARYPDIRLAGNLGVAAQDVAGLFDRGGVTLGIGPSLRVPLFNAGALAHAVEVAEANTAAALLAYRRAALRAMEEVEVALVAIATERSRSVDLDRSATASRRAVELASDQYKQGLVSFQSVLDAQRQLIASEDARAVSRTAEADASVSLYLALGGGIEARPLPLARSPSDSSTPESHSAEERP